MGIIWSSEPDAYLESNGADHRMPAAGILNHQRPFEELLEIAEGLRRCIREHAPSGLKRSLRANVKTALTLRMCGGLPCGDCGGGNAVGGRPATGGED